MKRTAWMLAWLGGVVAAGATAGPTFGQTRGKSPSLDPSLQSSEVLSLCKRLGEFADSLPAASRMGVAEVVAFEENRQFAYALGRTLSPGPGKPDEGPRLVRRFIFLKPSTLVVDDQVHAADGGAAPRWRLVSAAAPEVKGARVVIAEGGRKLTCETLLPRAAAPKAARQPGEGGQPGTWIVEVAPRAKADAARFIHVFDTAADQQASARPTLDRKGDGLEVTLSAGGLTYTLALPAGEESPGTIAAVNAEGKTVLGPRVFPSGILPHGPQGARLLERWDGAYHDGRRAAWDVGRASSQLRKAVEGGTIRPGRAVELGCGTGNDAIYLAGKGFDVTAIDIAPKALAVAAQKARQAGVQVRWVLADVLAPPELGTFDLIFDRGCYHGVRRTGAAAYVRTFQGLSHAGTRALIIAGNAKEPGTYGPPRVTEQEIRDDFSPSFDIVWLRETKFDTRDADEKGALAWSILLSRKKASPAAKPTPAR